MPCALSRLTDEVSTVIARHLEVRGTKTEYLVSHLRDSKVCILPFLKDPKKKGGVVSLASSGVKLPQ